MMKPEQKPKNPRFSSGPCPKYPGWTIEHLQKAVLGRSHRSKIGKTRLKQAIDRSAHLLQVPDDYLVGIVPASDTGAFEMALWSLLGARGVDVLAWESFGRGWVTDITKQLKLDNLRTLIADYGQLPDLDRVNPAHDIVFTWNGTTSGVKVPHGDWIDDKRAGLTICDATSAVYAMDLPWHKLDVTTFSWQKVMGGEAAHGMIILSPRAVERLENYRPSWPLPKIFRLSGGGKLIQSIFTGSTINTPSMLCVEDYLAALDWAEQMGGLKSLIDRSEKNLQVISRWVEQTDWIEFLAKDPETRSNTSVCLKICAPWFVERSLEQQTAIVRTMAELLEQEEAAFDIEAYRDAPPGLRLWAGATVESSDLEALIPWLQWAYHQQASSHNSVS